MRGGERPDRRQVQAPPVDYRGWEWVGGNLPCGVCDWAAHDGCDAALRDLLSQRAFVAPHRPHVAVFDVHGDAGALLRSLVGSGAVAKTGPDDAELELTEAGEGAVFVIGGDIFGGGPSNLRVLGVLEALIASGAEVVLLAGNEELRLLMGLANLGRRDVLRAHQFVRLGRVGVRLVQEVLASPEFRRQAGAGLASRPDPFDELDDAAALASLLPPPSWYEDFPAAAAFRVPWRQIGREPGRIREKSAEFRRALRDSGIAPALAWRAARFAREALLFGRYRWVRQRLRLAYRCGAYLFVHAGIGDGAAAVLRHEGVAGLDHRFAAALRRGDELAMYHGYLGNCARTRYRLRDEPLSGRGVADLHAAGIYAVLHGHGRGRGQFEVAVRRGLVDVTCDAVLDANTRAAQGFDGPGAGALVMRPDGQLWSVSVDHPEVKALDLSRHCGLFIQV